MGHPAGFVANPQQMRAISTELADAAKVIGQAYKSRRAELTPAAGSTAGWSTATAAATASQAWEVFVNRLASSASALAVQLRSAADAYDNADAEAADRNRRTGKAYR